MKEGRVLLADGHSNVLEGLREMLAPLFEAVVMVADERSLLEVAERLKPELAVVDLSLPVSDEVNVARRLKSHHPELKVIMLSVHDEPAVLKAVMESGAVGFVLKRSAATDLIPAVQEALQGRTYVSPGARDHSR
jgi:DNA-binding NarL/FixJ family response regulator